VALDEMSPWVRRATVAIEDRRFYEHSGLDTEGIARAALKNVESGGIVEGGSTITQ
jgi:membrane peptidoglycan carboxypeptidase